jgi:O-acetyl-ADP-ribose deacetylase (regulator of RNase III)
MDGGVDAVLSTVMFPGVEPRVKSAIREAGALSLLGRPFLQIGDALVVDTQVPGVFLISAPTMWVPQDVTRTQNAYHALYAILRAAVAHNRAGVATTIRDVYMTGLCTGCGRMSPAQAVGQMKRAHEDFVADRPPAYSTDEIVEQQPRAYMNTEFFDPTRAA